tara:strand:- start:420 stop:533 length:114 start_codon:yes stop_codon:yes gene_type:complete
MSTGKNEERKRGGKKSGEKMVEEMENIKNGEFDPKEI